MKKGNKINPRKRKRQKKTRECLSQPSLEMLTSLAQPSQFSAFFCLLGLFFLPFSVEKPTIFCLFCFFCLPGPPQFWRVLTRAAGWTGRRSPVSFPVTRPSRTDLVKAMSRQTDGSTRKTGRQGAASQAGLREFA